MTAHELTTDAEELRKEFERLHAPDSFEFKRSRKGTYINPSVARDWKWFRLGYLTAKDPQP